MSSQNISITLNKRDIVGKGLNKLKATGQVPAVIHRPGKDSVNVSASFIDMVKVYKAAGTHNPVTVTLDKETMLTMIKEVDVEASKNVLRHVVFGTINQNETIETEVSIVFEGDAPAAKLGLVVNKQLDTIKIEALPKDLPDTIVVNIESLTEVGDKIMVSDIKAPSGVTILTEQEHPVATVEEKQIIEEEPEAVVEEVAPEATTEETKAE